MKKYFAAAAVGILAAAMLILSACRVTNGDIETTAQMQSETAARTAAETVAETTSAPAEKPAGPVIPPEYAGNVCLMSVNRGACRMLRGDVEITVIFVDDAESKWNGEAVNAYREGIKKAENLLTEQAKEYGAELNITDNCLFAETKQSIEFNTRVLWLWGVLKSAGISAAEYLELNGAANTVERPLMICVNKPGRSSAQNSTYRSDGVEFAVMFNDPGSFAHELLHLFGAVDYYTGDEIVAASNKYFPDSIMKKSKGRSVDELTAFIVGWCDAPGKKARAFLDETNSIAEGKTSQ